jgi:excinuclease UvrABC nuclease subunit
MVEIALPTDPDELAALIESLPAGPAVFLLWPREGSPYLARTNVLRRRIGRMLEQKEGVSRGFSLRGTAMRLEYSQAGSKLESRFTHLELARMHLGADYRREIRLRLPPYVKLLLSNEFPRTQVAMRLGRAGANRSPANRSLYVGPFRNRSTAAQFESAFLDLFQLRRCQDDLATSPDHPGCIYGEMGKCLRPCQQIVSVDEYWSEAQRVAEFLRSGGQSLISSASGERERLSADMDFEGASRAHQRVMKIEEVLSFRDEMARDVDHLNAVAIVPSAFPECVALGWLRGGFWHGFRSLDFITADDGRAVSLDSRVREMAGTIPANRDVPSIERMEHLAILSRWFYSSWCDGELMVIDDWEKIPWRKLVNAVSRVAAAQRKPHPRTHS